MTCQTFIEYYSWFTLVVVPRLTEYYLHVKDCKECQEELLKNKDQMGITALIMSDNEFLEELSKFSDRMSKK
jgi:hypothetical protein